jgi:hypothetical protein
MLADQHNSLPQCELLIGPMLYRLIEGGARHENRTRSGDNPSDMQCVLIPQSCYSGNATFRLWIVAPQTLGLARVLARPVPGYARRRSSFSNRRRTGTSETCVPPRSWMSCTLWSQNLGHEHVMRTFCSYGDISSHRQSEIIRSFASQPVDAPVGRHTDL